MLIFSGTLCFTKLFFIMLFRTMLFRTMPLLTVDLLYHDRIDGGSMVQQKLFRVQEAPQEVFHPGGR
jgi:hypothetical protein